MMSRTHWSKKDFDFLNANYGVMPIDELAEKLGRSISAVRSKASRHGIGEIRVKGTCGREIVTKTWKQGHSIGCEKRGAKAIRFWQPAKKRYLWTRNWDFEQADLKAEVWDFCRMCGARDY